MFIAYSLVDNFELPHLRPTLQPENWSVMKMAYKQETVKEEWKYTNEVRCAGEGMILYPWPSISNQSSNSANRPDLYNSDLCWTFDHTVTRWFQCNEIRTIQHFRDWPLEPYMPTCTRHRDGCVGFNFVWVWMWVCHYLCNKLTNLTSMNNTVYLIQTRTYIRPWLKKKRVI